MKHFGHYEPKPLPDFMVTRIKIHYHDHNRDEIVMEVIEGGISQGVKRYTREEYAEIEQKAWTSQQLH